VCGLNVDFIQLLFAYFRKDVAGSRGKPLVGGQGSKPFLPEAETLLGFKRTLMRKNVRN